MPDTFQLEIVTPEKLVVKEAVEELQMPGASGYLGILPGHAPLITDLAVGELSYKVAGQSYRFAVCWGFAEVLPERVTVLAETCEPAAEIDVQRAQKAKARAEEQLKSGSPDVDYDRAQEALQRAETRLAVAGK